MNERAWMQNSLKKIRFGFIILVTAVLISATIFGLSHWINTRIEEDKTIEFVQEHFYILNTSSNGVVHLFVEIDHELERLSLLEEIQGLEPNAESEIFEVTYRDLSEYISCLQFLDEYGGLRSGYQGNCVSTGSDAQEDSPDWFLAAKREKEVVLSDIFADSQGQESIWVAYPILREDGGSRSVESVIAVAIRMKKIYEYMIPAIHASDRDWLHAFCIDTNSRNVYFPDHPPFPGSEILEGESDCGKCHGTAPDFENLADFGQRWETLENFNGGKKIVLSSPVRFANRSWVIGLIADYDRATVEAGELANYINFIAALSCMIVLFGSIISFSLIRARRTADMRGEVIVRERELLKKVRDSEERYRTLFEGVRSGVYVSTPEGKFREVNDAMVGMLGYDSKAELIGIDIESELYAIPEDRVIFTQEIEKHVVIEDLETRLLRRDNSQIICLETAYGRRDESGRIVEYLGVLVDITGRKRIEAELEDSRRRLRELFDGASVAIFVEDMEGNILDVNRKAIEVYGYGRDEFLSMSAIDLMQPEDARNFDRFVEQLAKSGSFELETQSRTKSGRFIDVEISAQSVTVEEEILIQLFVRDVSEIRQKEREIREKKDELNTLHEISKIASQSLVIDDILDLTIRKTIEVTPFDAGSVYVLDTNSESFHLRASFGIPEEVVEEFRVIRSDRPGESIMGQIARDKEIMILEPESMDQQVVARQTGLGSQAYIGIPILHSQRVVAVMNLLSFTRLKREEHPVGLLKGLGELVGIAISNANLYGESQKRASEMQVLYEAGKTFMAITDIDRLARKVVEVAREELGYEACTILSMSEDKKELSILDATYLRKGEKRKDRFRVGVDGNVGWVAEKRQLCHVQDISSDNRYLPGWVDTGSELAIPLMVGEEMLGVLDFERDTVNGFTPDEIRFLSLFANQVAWALYNVKLFEEIRKANEDLNRVSEMKTQFVSLVSHELRTPMTAIKGSLDIIHSGAAGPVHEKQKMFISMARRNIDRLNDMVNNILDLSRMEAGKIEFEFSEVNFQEPLNHVLLTLSSTANENNIVLESHLPSDLPALYADEAKVEQILTNLIGNALKHTPSGGRVTVVAGRATEKDLGRLRKSEAKIPSPNDYVRISVVDTGSGIPSDQLDAIFDRYKQLQGKKGERGTGLGLAICRYMVEEQNGAVWAERGAEVGSVLCFILPVYRGEKPAQVKKEGAMPPSSPS